MGMQSLWLRSEHVRSACNKCSECGCIDHSRGQGGCKVPEVASSLKFGSVVPVLHRDPVDGELHRRKAVSGLQLGRMTCVASSVDWLPGPTVHSPDKTSSSSCASGRETSLMGGASAIPRQLRGIAGCYGLGD